MQKNVGQLDAYMRISGGLTLLGWGIMKRSTPAVAIGAMKVAEGVTRFCPMLYLLGLNTLRPEGNSDEKLMPEHNG